MNNVIVYKDEDLHWPFEGKPYFIVKMEDKKRFAQSIYVDPFPCYAHDPEIVKDMIPKVHNSFPIGMPVDYYIVPFECESRTNGQADQNSNYEGKEPYPWDGRVTLWGKRIPPHPAMTRYLVAHEYGHHVKWWIEYKRGEERHSVGGLEKLYAELRGVEPNKGYGGRRWHQNIAELIVNDFRIVVAKVELEFWPHPGFTYPTDLPLIVDF